MAASTAPSGTRKQADLIITGRTRLFAVVGDPIVQVRSPEVFNSLFSLAGLDAVMVPVHVSAGDLVDVWSGFRNMKNLVGIGVTMPHKASALELCDEIGNAAQLVGAVNAIRRNHDGRMIGESFDGAGFVAGLRSRNHDPKGFRVLLAGCGGAASAVALALADAGIAQLTLVNRTVQKAEVLHRRLMSWFPSLPVAIGSADPTGHDLVINATALGMASGDPLPVQLDKLAPGTLVADLVLTSDMTPLLVGARQRGCKIHPGRHMLEGQAHLMMRFMCSDVTGIPQ